MINKQHRFTHRFAVQAVYKKAKTVRAPMITIKYVIKPNQPWRAAVVVSKKVSKSAVKRNRIRRRVFELLRTNEELIKPGTQMIVSIFDESIAEQEADNLKVVVSKLLADID